MYFIQRFYFKLNTVSLFVHCYVSLQSVKLLINEHDDDDDDEFVHTVYYNFHTSRSTDSSILYTESIRDKTANMHLTKRCRVSGIMCGGFRGLWVWGLKSNLHDSPGFL